MERDRSGKFVSTNGRRYSNGDPSSKYANILQTLTVVAIVVGGAYAGIILPIHGKVDELRDTVRRVDESAASDRERIKTGMDRRITREEHEEFKRRLDELISSLRAELKQGGDDTRYLRDNLVGRAENVTHWDQSKQIQEDIRAQVDMLRRDFGGQFTVADKLKDVQKQLDDLRVAMAGQHVTIANPPSFQMPPAPPPRP